MGLISNSKFVINRKIAWLLGFSVLSLLLVGYMIYAGKKSLGKTNFQISRSYEVIGVIQQLKLIASESEAASFRQRMTGDPAAGHQIENSRLEWRLSLDSL